MYTPKLPLAKSVELRSTIETSKKNNNIADTRSSAADGKNQKYFAGDYVLLGSH